MTVPFEKRLVVVPMKDPCLSKTRLSGELSGPARAVLARNLFQRSLEMLSALREEIGKSGLDLVVVTSSAEIRQIAYGFSVAVLEEPQPCSLNGALEYAAAWAAGEGYDSLCILPADLAMPTRAEVLQLLTTPLDPHQMVLCPAQDMGTNALLMALPAQIPLQYGVRSFVKHFQSAEAAGLNPMMLPLSSLKRDVDTSRDLALLLDHAPELSRTLRTT